MRTFCTGTRVLGAVAVATAMGATTLANGQVAVETGILVTQKAPASVKKPPLPAPKATMPAQQAGADPLKAMVPAAAPVTRRVELAPQMNLFEGKSTLMRLPSPATRLSVGDSSIADVI